LKLTDICIAKMARGPKWGVILKFDSIDPDGKVEPTQVELEEILLDLSRGKYWAK